MFENACRRGFLKTQLPMERVKSLPDWWKWKRPKSRHMDAPPPSGYSPHKFVSQTSSATALLKSQPEQHRYLLLSSQLSALTPPL